jgi:hypothetical protein
MKQAANQGMQRNRSKRVGSLRSFTFTLGPLMPTVICLESTEFDAG